MKMKRMVSLCLSLFLLTGAAFAAETPVSPAPSYEIAPVTDQTLTRVWGTAVEVGEDQVRLNNSNEEDPLSDIILNVDEETLVLDAVTGEELSFDQVEKDDVIYAYVGAAMTHAPATVKKYLGFTLLPHSGVSLVFTGVAVSVLSGAAPDCAELLQGTIAAAAVINEIIAVFMARKGFEWAGKLGQAGKNNQREELSA